MIVKVPLFQRGGIASTVLLIPFKYFLAYLNIIAVDHNLF